MTPGDIAVLGILFVSAILAFFRGFTREVLAIAGWVGAALVTLYTFPVASDVARTYISMDLLADIVGGTVVFIVTLIVLSIICHYIARLVTGSAINAIDRSLGFLFGLLRGAALVSLGYLVIVWFFPDPASRPDWVADARSEAMVARGAAILVSVVPDETMADGLGRADGMRGRIDETLDSYERLRRLDPSRFRDGDPSATTPPENPDTGYSDSARGRLESLIEHGN
ncbi:CvpA family protein [Fodinicurvata sp. EGI_FJ10296]|uniref:CvpA family protein n=1 Tax=Fodinicurvata sp. EGI_FJ10296 TaxID=3231908 RepID=UPI0034512FA2